MRTLMQTPAIAARFRLNGVVTLVDAKNILRRLQVGPKTEGRRQMRQTAAAPGWPHGAAVVSVSL